MEELNQELARAAYEAHIEAAMALAADQVLAYRLDPDRVTVNVKRGMRVLENLGDRIAQHLPEVDLAGLGSLPSLVLAVKYGALMVRHTVGGVSAAEMIMEGWQLRRTLLPVVSGLAAVGVIPQKVYDKIAKGRGVRDMAEDCVALSKVFYDFADQVAGKHAAGVEIIERADVVGSWLVENLGKRSVQPLVQVTAELEARDRLATLLVQRYSDLRAVAYYFYRDSFGDHVPRLMAGQASRKRAPDSDAGEPDSPDSDAQE